MVVVRNALTATSLALLSLLTLAPVQTQAAPYGVVVQPGQPGYGEVRPGQPGYGQIRPGQPGYGQGRPGQPVYEQGRPVYIPAPPPPRREATPRARRGQVWVQGHWEWSGRRHVWAPGYWMQARPGHQYRQHQWVQRNGQWQMRGGGWDRDRDGVPNRYDRRPDNPYRN